MYLKNPRPTPWSSECLLLSKILDGGVLADKRVTLHRMPYYSSRRIIMTSIHLWVYERFYAIGTVLSNMVNWLVVGAG